MTHNSLSGVSVIICCYNSSARLSKTLEYISQQEVPGYIPWEVIIVDNNSTDNTASVARKIWNALNCTVPFKVIQESTPGLTYARKKGIAEASYDLLVFCDDDNWLERNYIQTAYGIMNEHENIGVLGAKSTGFYETEKPTWFDRFGQAYAIGKPARQSGIINARTFVAGAGMILKKSTLQLLEMFSFKQLLSDRKGNQLSSGGDAELCLVLLFLGFDLYYDERLQFVHFMPANRLSWEYCVSMISKGHAIPQVHLQFYNYCHKKAFQNEKTDFRDAYAAIRQKLLRELLRTIVHMKPFWYSLRLLAKSLPGSRNEIALKANLNKLKYLLTHKKDLRQDYNTIYALIQNIHQYKSASVKQLAPLDKIS